MVEEQLPFKFKFAEAGIVDPVNTNMKKQGKLRYSEAFYSVQEITVIPLSIAFLPIGTRASLSFAEIAIASTF